MTTSTSPLEGIKVLDLSALGPGPFATMLLADHGADVLQIVRPGPSVAETEYLSIKKNELCIDLKNAAGRELVRTLAAGSDVFVEGFRPGVMERLGLGPADLHAVNEGLIYVRLTGWGQDGPAASTAGHDINYLAMAGALAAIGADQPVPPLALVGDFAGGGLFAVIGTLLALLQRGNTGKGQVVDVAIVDGVSTLMWSTLARTLKGEVGPRGTNLLDGGAPFYRAYRCSDGEFFAVGAIEPKFFLNCLKLLGLPAELAERQYDRDHWAEMAQTFARTFALRSREEWTAVFDGADACGSPVLTISESAADPHLVGRGTYRHDERQQPALAAAPRLSTRHATLADRQRTDLREALLQRGLPTERVDHVVHEATHAST